MKKFVFALLLIPALCFAQNETGNDSIPVVEGKVVFSSEYHPDLSKSEIHQRLEKWLTYSFLKENERINLNDTIAGTIACRKTDELDIHKKALSVFRMNMKYTLVLEYKDNYCLAAIRSISYSDPDEVLSQYQEMPTSYPGEAILLEKRFKNLFIKDASDKIASKTLDRVEEIFQNIDKQLKFTSKEQKDASKTRRNVSTKAVQATPDN